MSWKAWNYSIIDITMMTMMVIIVTTIIFVMHEANVTAADTVC